MSFSEKKERNVEVIWFHIKPKKGKLIKGQNKRNNYDDRYYCSYM